VFKVGQTIDLSEKEMLHLCFTAHFGIVGCLKVVEQFAHDTINKPQEPERKDVRD
jgi:hypothetical protein